MYWLQTCRFSTMYNAIARISSSVTFWFTGLGIVLEAEAHPCGCDEVQRASLDGRYSSSEDGAGVSVLKSESLSLSERRPSWSSARLSAAM